MITETDYQRVSLLKAVMVTKDDQLGSSKKVEVLIGITFAI
jgi:hypothetical protein